MKPSDSDVAHDVAHDVVSEAADWFARLRGASLSEPETARFQAWLAGPPAHRQELEKLRALVGAARGRSSVTGNSRRLRREQPLRVSSRDAGADVRSRVSRRAVLGWGMAASVAGAAAICWAGSTSPSRRLYSTGIGELRSVTLNDGSMVMLNTRRRFGCASPAARGGSS